MEDENYIYLRFPVQILKCDFGNISKVCKDAMAYGIMDYMERNEYEGVKGCIRAYEELNLVYDKWNRSEYFDQSEEAINHIEELHYATSYHEKTKRYNELKDSIDTKITCSIKKDLLLDFLNNKKSEFEIAVFRFFIALNSIQGTKPYGQTTYDRAFAVMFGYNTDKVLKHGLGKREKIDLDLLTPNERVIYLKYSTQSKRQKIVETLELHWHLKWVGATYDGSFFSWGLGYKALNTIKRMAVIKRKKPKEKLKRDKKKGKEESDKELKDNAL